MNNVSVELSRQILDQPVIAIGNNLAFIGFSLFLLVVLGVVYKIHENKEKISDLFGASMVLVLLVAGAILFVNTLALSFNYGELASARNTPEAYVALKLKR